MQRLLKRLLGILFLIVSEHQVLIFGLHQPKRDSCIALVANRYFRRNSTVALITASFQDSQQQPSVSLQPVLEGDDVLLQVDLRWEFSIVLLQMTLRKTSICTCTDRLESFWAFNYFIIVANGDDTATCIETFCFVGLTGYLTRFVVYLNTKPEDAHRHVQGVLERFWRHNHQNVIVLVTNQEGDVDVFTWFPLEENPRPKIVDKCDGHLLRKNTPLLPKKIPHDLNGRNLKVGFISSPPYTCRSIDGGYAGVDVEIMDAMASVLNFTMDYVLAKHLRRGNESEQGYWHGHSGPWKAILREVLEGRIDIGLGGFTMEPKAIDFLGYTVTYYRDATGIFATSDLILAHDMGRWMAMILPMTAFVHICTALAMHLLERRTIPARRDFGRSAIMVWSLLTEETAGLSRLSSRQVCLWALCAFYAINMNTAFRSLLTSSLASPLYVEKLQTAEDVTKYNTPLLIHGEQRVDPVNELGLNQLFSAEDIAVLLKRVQYCTDPLYRCLLKIRTVPQYSLYGYNLDMQFIQSSLPNLQYHKLTRDMYFSEIIIHTKKNFFLTPKMSMMILRSAQAGLTNYWLMKSLNNYNLCSLSESDWGQLVDADATRPHPREYRTNIAHSLGMKRIEIHFWMLTNGLLVAGVVFIFELWSVNRKCRLVWARFKNYAHHIFSKDE